MFAAIAFMGFVAVGCGGNAPNPADSKEVVDERIPMSLEGTIWRQMDRIAAAEINLWEIYFEPCWRTLYYFQFMGDNKVKITKWEEPYMMSGKAPRVIDSMECKYTYKAPKGIITCLQDGKTYPFNIEIFKDKYYKEHFYVFLVLNDFGEKERVKLLQSSFPVSLSERMMIIQNIENLK